MPGGWAMSAFWGRAATPDTQDGRQRRRRLSLSLSLSLSRCLCWHLLQFTGETQAPCSYSANNATEVPWLHINKVDFFLFFFLLLWNDQAEGWSQMILFVCFDLFYRLGFYFISSSCKIVAKFHVYFQCGCFIHAKIKRIRPRYPTNIKERNRWMFSLMQYWYCHVYSSTHFPPESNQADKTNPQGSWFRRTIDPSLCSIEPSFKDLVV